MRRTPFLHAHLGGSARIAAPKGQALRRAVQFDTDAPEIHDWHGGYTGFLREPIVFLEASERLVHQYRVVVQGPVTHGFESATF